MIMFFLENLRIVFYCDSTGLRSFAPILNFFHVQGTSRPMILLLSIVVLLCALVGAVFFS
jgi:hypothetical protein